MLPQRPERSERAGLAWRLLAAVVLLGLAWLLREAVIVAFGAVLIAAALVAPAKYLQRWTGWPQRRCVLLVVLGVTAALAALFWLLGAPLAEQMRNLRQELPRAWSLVQGWLDQQAWGRQLLELLGKPQDMQIPLSGIAGVATGTLRAVSGAVLVLLMGVYLALDVPLYRRGLVRLFPPARRAQIDGALADAGHALTRWLMGQGVMMVVVGVVATVGLSLLGMPMALALGLIAGLLEFVPFFGPIVSGLIAVLVAFSQGPQMALYVALLFFAIQQLEEVLLVPLVQRWAVKLPPVLGLLGVMVFGTLFGLPGIVFGTPLMVLGMVLVQRLYVEQTLEGRA